MTGGADDRPVAGSPTIRTRPRRAGPASREPSDRRDDDCGDARRPRAPSARQRSDNASCRLGSVPPSWTRVRRGLRSSPGTANGGARDALRGRYVLLASSSVINDRSGLYTQRREHSRANSIFTSRARRERARARENIVRRHVSNANRREARASFGTTEPLEARGGSRPTRRAVSGARSGDVHRESARAHEPTQSVQCAQMCSGADRARRYQARGPVGRRVS
jgi:hypothetical protein